MSGLAAFTMTAEIPAKNSKTNTPNAAGNAAFITTLSFLAIWYLLDCHGPTMHTDIHAIPYVSPHTMFSAPVSYRAPGLPLHTTRSCVLGLSARLPRVSNQPPPEFFAIKSAAIISEKVNTLAIRVSVIKTPLEPEVIEINANTISASVMQIL